MCVNMFRIQSRICESVLAELLPVAFPFCFKNTAKLQKLFVSLSLQLHSLYSIEIVLMSEYLIF